MAAQPPRSYAPSDSHSPTAAPPEPKRLRTSSEEAARQPPHTSHATGTTSDLVQHASPEPPDNDTHASVSCCECQCNVSEDEACCPEGEKDGDKSAEGSDSGEETLDVEYWDSLYEGNAEEDTNSEYLLSYFTLRPLLLKHLYLLRDENTNEDKSTRTDSTEKMRLLVPGCGDSSLAESLSADGFEVHASDISTSVIAIMQNKSNEHSGVQWVVDDATKMKFADEFFHFIVDKSLIDCIYWVKDEGVHIDEVIQKTLSEYYRTLHTAGCAIVVTIRNREQFLPFIDKKIQHTNTDFRQRRKQKEVAEPPDWVYLCFEILAERIEGAVPTNAVAIDVESDEELEVDDEKDYAKFYIYVLRKL